MSEPKAGEAVAEPSRASVVGMPVLSMGALVQRVAQLEREIAEKDAALERANERVTYWTDRYWKAEKEARALKETLQEVYSAWNRGDVRLDRKRIEALLSAGEHDQEGSAG